MPMDHSRRVTFDGSAEYLAKLNQELVESPRYSDSLSDDELRNRIIADITSNATRQQRSLNQWITNDPSMLEMKKRLVAISHRSAPVLITGPTGTGKGLLAKALCPDGKPFIVATCGGLVDGLVPSQFFGHIRGAFTGAIDNKEGYFQAAKDGVVLLDEIGDLPMHLQATLLHAIQEMEIYKVGSNRPEEINCRFVAATNYNLEERIESHTFREDLYARLSVFHIKLSSLLDRPGDIEAIARALGYDGDLPFPSSVLDRIAKQNVRAIENAIERWRAYGAFD